MAVGQGAVSAKKEFQADAPSDLCRRERVFASPEGLTPPLFPPWGSLPRSASGAPLPRTRSEEHTSELQSLMRISYAVFCLKKKKQQIRKPPYSSNTQNTNKKT